MNHYSRHIGDWRGATGNLTRVQRDIYSSLLDTYYDKEQPLTADFEMLAEDHGCRTEDEQAALRYILRRYFVRDGSVWRHERCDEEIAHIHQLILVKSKAGKASGTARGQRRMNKTGTGVQQASNTTSTESNTGATTQYPIPNTQPVPVGTGGESSAASPTPPPAPPPTTPPGPPPAPEGKVVQMHRPSKKAPKDFEVTPAMAQWAATECPLLSVQDIERETGTFKDHTFSRAISDWVGAWRNWLRKEQKFRESKPHFRHPAANGHVVTPAQAKAQRTESFRNAVMGNSNAAGRDSALDVESRVVRDGEEFPPDSGA